MINKKVLIIITGELAAGKTSYGKKISEELEIPFYSKDDIKEILFDSSCDNKNMDYENKKRIGANSYTIFYYIIEQQMKAGVPVIAESNFVKESIQPIKKLLNQYNYSAITIRFEGDLCTLHNRFLRREYSNERHPGLIANGKFDSFNSFEETAIKSREFKIEGEEIIVDTTNFSNVNLSNIIQRIQDYSN